MKRVIWVIMLLSVAIWPLEADILEQILVKINGDIITKTELEKRQIAFLRQTNRQDVLVDDEALAQALRENTPDIIVNAIDEMLLAQRGRELGYSLSDEQFDEIVENLKEQNELETDEQFAAALEQEAMTLADLRLAMERQMLVSRVQQVEVFGNFSVTEEEEREYYDANLDEFLTPSMVTLREILLEIPDLRPVGSTQPMINVAQEEVAKAKIEVIRARVVGGEDFGLVAGEVSEAPSKATGGLIGPILLDELATMFAEVVTTLEVGAVSAPMRTTSGYHLIKLESSTGGGTRTVRRREKLAGPEDVQRAARRGGRQVSQRVARTGDHRVEERRPEGGLRDRSGAGRRSVSQPDPSSDQLNRGRPHRAGGFHGLERRHARRGCRPPTVVCHRTRSRHEQVVREQLARKGYEVFLPTITRWSRWKDRKKKIRLATLPRLLLRACRPGRQGPGSLVHRSRQHCLVCRRTRSHSGR